MRALKVYLLGLGTVLLVVAGLATLDAGYLYLTGDRPIFAETAQQRLAHAQHAFAMVLQHANPPVSDQADQWNLVEPAGEKNQLGLYHFTWINCRQHLEIDVMLQYDPVFLVQSSPILPLAASQPASAACT